MFDIIGALEYLHSRSPPIIHRDIKPENILINKKVMQIADFGWSNEKDNKDFRNTFCGTPDYLAPEMILGNGHNEKLDMWTVGILMYELLHGKPPFTPKTKKTNRRMQQREIEKNILEGNIEFDKSISRDCKEVMISLLNGNKELRPGASEVLDFPFFAKRKLLMIKQTERQSERSISSTALENENKELRRKLEESEKRKKDFEFQNQKSEMLIKGFQKQISTLEGTIKQMEQHQRGSRRYNKGNYNNSVGILTDNSGKGYFEEGLPKKGDKAIVKSRGKKLELETLKRELKDLRDSSLKTDDRVQGLEKKSKRLEGDLKNSRSLNIKFFDKHKSLSTRISNFYLNHYREELKGTERGQLDFEDMFKKLEEIFNEFKFLKSKSRISENRSTLGDQKSIYQISEKPIEQGTVASYNFGKSSDKLPIQTYSNNNLNSTPSNYSRVVKPKIKSSNSIKGNLSVNFPAKSKNGRTNTAYTTKTNYTRKNPSPNKSRKNKSINKKVYFNNNNSQKYLNKKNYISPNNSRDYLGVKTNYSPKSNRSEQGTPSRYARSKKL